MLHMAQFVLEFQAAVLDAVQTFIFKSGHAWHFYRIQACTMMWAKDGLWNFPLFLSCPSCLLMLASTDGPEESGQSASAQTPNGPMGRWCSGACKLSTA